MKEGFLADASRPRVRVGQWAEGAPAYRFLDVLRMRGRRRVPIRAMRCTRCGLLELYAEEAPSR